MINLLITFIEDEQPSNINQIIQNLGLSLQIHPGVWYLRTNLSPNNVADELFAQGAKPNIFLAVVSSTRSEGTPIETQKTLSQYGIQRSDYQSLVI